MPTTRKNQPKLTDCASKDLVIVESPAKARTVGQILGDQYSVIASQGHVRDLPSGRLAIEVENQFEPTYVVPRKARPHLTELKKAGDSARQIFLATDPDREGEAIAWHIQDSAGWLDRDPAPKRIVFHEITKTAVQDAVENPRDLDMDLVNAQQARRILDRLVGYQVTGLLRARVQRSLSAGRVQSPTMKMVVDRQQEIDEFKPKESWSIEADLSKQDDSEKFQANLYMAANTNSAIHLEEESQARDIESELENSTYTVSSSETTDSTNSPSAPFTTSTMQQEASRKLRYQPDKTMRVAQELYQGVDIDNGNAVGLITYMRTDSTNVASTAISEIREYINKEYGPGYLPNKATRYTKKSASAQEAHEAIRPTSVIRTPESLVELLNKDQLRLYSLIWSRTVASQMSNSVTETTTITIDAGPKHENPIYKFRTTDRRLKFSGFRKAYDSDEDETVSSKNELKLPLLKTGDELKLICLTKTQHFTRPPARFTEATLVKAMEENGIGRPSTYVSTIATLKKRFYLERSENGIIASPDRCLPVTKLLAKHLPSVMDVQFTASMEGRLDQVASGSLNWIEMLDEFWSEFEPTLSRAYDEMPKVSLDVATDKTCSECGSPMIQKIGPSGRFLGCSTFPTCKYSQSITTGISCRTEGCEGELIEVRTRNSRPFWGCSNHPECTFTASKRPWPEPCPECDGLMIRKSARKLACVSCAWEEEITE